ncbi:MAG TPA: hypothetical protein VI564_02645 [Candidatus Nanoarchaeia archaeon]|nr:hypothetical protein [Candidatus Nanoarchaeia archaeon]
MDNIKEDVKFLLVSYFGEKIGELVEKYYDEENLQELIQMAQSMISGLLGPQNSVKQLKPICDKYSVKIQEI